jgi:tetratricopeptide (TPR) repeat protein
LRRWLDQHPADAATRLYYASMLLQAGDHRQAAEHYQHILKRDRNNLVALNDLAWAYLQSHDQRAQETAEQAHRLAPANPTVTDTLAWVLAETGASERALPLFKQALRQAPAAADIRFHYAQALLRAGDKRNARLQCEQLLAVRDLAQRREVQALLAKL